MLRGSEVRQQHGHFVERPPSDGLVIAAARQVVADLLLVDPQETMQRDDIGVADERQAVIARVQRLTVRRYLNEEPATHVNNRRRQQPSACIVLIKLRFRWPTRT